MRFEKGKLPPADAFWSLTMYDDDFFFVPNAINRYDLAQRDKLVANADGSIDLYLQAESPGKDKEANWLPAPKGKFVLVMRIYAAAQDAAVDPRRHVDAAAGEEGAVKPKRARPSACLGPCPKPLGLPSTPRRIA